MTALAGTLYKIFCLISGVLFAYFGYRLFLSGVWGRSGDLETAFRDSKLVLKGAAPGTFFVLFGAVIIGITVWKDTKLSEQRVTTSVAPTGKPLQSNEVGSPAWETCVAMITDLPRDYNTWSPDQKAHLKRVHDLCTKFITSTITTRIKTTTSFGTDKHSDRIDAWLRTSGNRQRLRNWLKTQTPKINVFTLLQGDFRELRERAIKHFQIP